MARRLVYPAAQRTTVKTNNAANVAGLNPEQAIAASHLDGPMVVQAQAGSGKTHTLIELCGNLVKSGVDPKKILAVTFSKKAADEMNARGNKKGYACTFSTWHAFALNVLKEDQTTWAKWEIDESDRAKYAVKDALSYKHLDWKDADLGQIRRYIAFCKAHNATPDSPKAAELAKLHVGKRPDWAVRAYAISQDLIETAGLLTFDDMLCYCAQWLSNEENRKHWAAKFSFVIQDEAQDSNPVQTEIAELLTRDSGNYIVVGDPAQCHPAGTLIQMEDGNYCPIEHLDDGDLVKSWNQNAQKMISGRKVSVASRPYTGKLFDVVVDGKTVPTTPNHKFVARWTNRNTDTTVVYMMYREDRGFRVGWCKLFNQGKDSLGLHLAQRARIEKADSVWILKVCGNRTDASVYESIVAAKYGLPTATFEPVHDTIHQTEAAISEIFSALKDNNQEHCEGCLSDHNKFFSLPLYHWPNKEKNAPQGRRTIFEVYASNLEPSIMSVPLPTGVNVWAPVQSVSNIMFTGKVYSLDVEIDHSYSANGVVVLNSIYGFRGSSPEAITSFARKYPNARVVTMNRNYRSGSAIIDVANKVIAPAKVRLPTDMIAECGSVGSARCIKANNLDDEANEFRGYVQNVYAEGGRYSDTTCLFRTNAQSRALEEALLSAQIPYIILGGTSFYERKEVKDILGYLRVASGADKDGEGLKRCLNAPFRFLGAKFVEKVSFAKRPELDWVDAVSIASRAAGIQARQKTAALEWAERIKEVATGIKNNETPDSILTNLVAKTRFIEWLSKDEGGESLESSHAANVRELIRVSARFKTVEALLTYINKSIQAASKQRKEANAGGDRVLLMSIHRSKGLEWKNVWVVGLNEKILPHAMGDIEEERRLAYVAFTRAKENLTVSWVTSFTTGEGLKPGHPSPFLLDAGLIDGPQGLGC